MDIRALIKKYINKNIFRAAIIFLVIYTVYVAALNDFDFSTKKIYSCPLNPLNKSCYINIGCEGVPTWVNCTPKEEFTLFPGQTRGEEPPPEIENFPLIVITTLSAAFVANHIYFMYKERKRKKW